eukprot:14266362-Ditylum_brightwellii.AAC.1
MPGFPHASSVQGTTHTSIDKCTILFHCNSSSKLNLQEAGLATSRSTGPLDGQFKEKGKNLPQDNMTLDLMLSLYLYPSNSSPQPILCSYSSQQEQLHGN